MVWPFSIEKRNKYMAQMEPKTFTMTNIQSGDKSELSTDGTKDCAL